MMQKNILKIKIFVGMWNILFKSSTILNEIKKFQLNILEVCQKALKDNLKFGFHKS